MYFDDSNKVDINELVNDSYSIYAHVNNGKYEKLEEHINLCTKYFFQVMTSKGVYSVFEKLEKEFLMDFQMNQ